MVFTAKYQKYSLKFKRPSGTSRGIMTTKDTYFVFLKDSNNPNKIAIGECGLLKGLSHDDRPNYETKLQQVCQQIKQIRSLEGINRLCLSLLDYPSIRFGVEMAFQDLVMGSQRIFYDNYFTQGKPIPINGLIWMGEIEFMRQQIIKKIESGFSCLKLKIGAIDWETELQLIASIRQEFSANDIEIRVDANGAFSPSTALEKLELLAKYNLHSIEQPIKQNQWQEMALLCDRTPLPIALDEELIGINNPEEKDKLVNFISPQYLIFKPSLIGGFKATQEWIDIANEKQIPWWITSALESNIGLNAIAQFTANTNNKMPQGLGTGQLYTNNIDSPLEVKAGHLYYRPNLKWNLSSLH